MSDSESIDSRISRVEERLSAIDRAWVIQAEELKRRLEDLNHAHARAMDDRQQTVQKETFEVIERENRVWRESVNRRLDMINGKAIGYAIAAGVFATTITILLRVVSVIK